MKEYKILTAFFLGNTRMKSGDVVNLHERQAVFLVAGGFLEPMKTPKLAAKAAKSAITKEVKAK